MDREALKTLDGFTGTESYHRHPLVPSMVFTDGVMFLANNASCHWLVDQICISQQLSRIARDPMLQDMQFWSLKKGDGNSATLVCERDSGDVAFTRKVGYTDFPFDAVPNPRIWVCNNVLMLPSEY